MARTLSSHNLDSLPRRHLMGLVGASLLAGGGHADAVTPKLDLTSMAGRLRVFMLTQGALDDQLVIGCSTGRYYGVIDAVLTPVHDIAAVTFARHRPLASGGYEIVSLEQAYYTDIESGRALRSLRNPYTGKMVAVPTTGVPPNKTTLSPNLEFRRQNAKPASGVVIDHKLLPIIARGDDVWMPEETTIVRQTPGQAKPFRYHEVAMLHARRGELENPSATHVDCVTSFNAVLSWRPWLDMGDRPGEMLVIATGRSGATLDSLPSGWIEETENVWPALLKNPAAALDPVWAEKT